MRWRLLHPRPMAKGFWYGSIHLTRCRCRGPFPGRGRRRPAASYKIKELDVHAKLADQVAQVQVSQSFVNTGSRQMEVCFVFPLPYDGAIDQLTLLVDGKEYDAKLLTPRRSPPASTKAIVRKNQDPALLEWIGTGMFKTSVFPVPPGAERKVTLRYSPAAAEGPRPDRFHVPAEHRQVHVAAGREAGDSTCAIESGTTIKNVYSPTHAVEIKRPDNKHAVVKFEANEHGADGRLPPVLRRGRRQARRERAQLPARSRATTATSCCWPAPRSRPTTPSGPRRPWCSSSTARAA